MEASEKRKFDVIVIGAGHAGCEAAHAAARMGAGVLLITGEIDRIGWLSCNPAMGGQAKGQMIVEIDALGGIIGEITDRAGIQFRELNTRKGIAMRTLRAQCDRGLYHREIRHRLETTENLAIVQDTVRQILLSPEQKVRGVCCPLAGEFSAPTVVLAAGTFLNGVLHYGEKSLPGGRAGEKPVDGLSDILLAKKIPLIRLKTGTPPRVDGKTVDLKEFEQQPGDTPLPFFSRRTKGTKNPQVPCYLGYTNEETHKVIRENLHRSAMYSGRIQSVGPRYCPSIEDKIVRFPERESHQVFLEPEGIDTNEFYVNGVSTSLPPEVQEEYLRTIKGMQNVRITRYGYAVEYDAFDPRYIYPTCESKVIPGLFLAGQINGTTGYEEAAAQGLIAGVNAVLKLDGKVFTLNRQEAFVGVMMDDLTRKGISEPYRMFTSRAEWRLNLRIDNAEERLLGKGFELGLVEEEEWNGFLDMRSYKNRLLEELECRRVGGRTAIEKIQSRELLPEDIGRVIERELPSKLSRTIWAEVFYKGYLKKQEEEVIRIDNSDDIRLDHIEDFGEIPGLRREVVERLNRFRPETLGKARLLEGVNPADVVLIMNRERAKSKKVQRAKRTGHDSPVPRRTETRSGSPG